MNAQHLIHMANQISLFFESQPTQEEAVAVLEHLKRFWDPRMGAAIIECVGTGGDGLRDVARAAVVRLAADKKNAHA